MLFKCYSCGQAGFGSYCASCGSDDENDIVSLQPQFYPEFQYRSQGFVKDLFVKRKTEKHLQSKLDSVLTKYDEFEKPYFVNYMQLAGRGVGQDNSDNSYSSLLLFQNVLLRLGFDELMEFPQLAVKLVRSTSFRFQYEDFSRRTQLHFGAGLEASLRSWIEERGSAFRRELPTLLFCAWENGFLRDDVRFSPDQLPLVAVSEMDRLMKLCEDIYFDVLVSRFKITLEQFDQTKFVTMYAVDAMDGYEFEDFLVRLFTTIGYDVESTKKGADQGADLFAERFGQKIVIQAKNYKDSVGNAAVQQALAAKSFYNCDDAMVVTNNYFTGSAKDLAAASGVRLVSRTELQEYLDEYNRTIMDQAARAES